jgi:prepilin-type processing-associated H-X9-DG protein
MRTQSMSNMRQILLGCVMYASDNKDQWPKDLSAAEKYLGGPAKLQQIMVNPSRPDAKPAYVYVQPAGDGPVANPASTLVLYESHTDFGPGVSVGFADGHVEFVRNRERFDQLLAGPEAAPAVP